MNIYFEIHHKSFNDNTPRHPLVSISINDQSTMLLDEIKEYLEKCHICESDGDGWYYYELISGKEDSNKLLALLMDNLSIVGSIYVEYYIKSRSKFCNKCYHG